MGPESGDHVGCYQRFKSSVKHLKRQVLAVYYALEEPEVGWLPRIIAILAIGYALSPLDFIPDFIPILGLIDDLLILPGLLWLAVWLIPDEVMQKARLRADNEPLRLASNWIAATLFFALWNFFFGWGAFVLVKHFGSPEVVDLKWWIVGGVVGVATISEIIWAVFQIRFERRRAAENGTRQPLLAPNEPELLEP